MFLWLGRRRLCFVLFGPDDLCHLLDPILLQNMLVPIFAQLVICKHDLVLVAIVRIVHPRDPPHQLVSCVFLGGLDAQLHLHQRARRPVGRIMLDRLHHDAQLFHYGPAQQHVEGPKPNLEQKDTSIHGGG